MRQQFISLCFVEGGRGRDWEAGPHGDGVAWRTAPVAADTPAGAWRRRSPGLVGGGHGACTCLAWRGEGARC